MSADVTSVVEASIQLQVVRCTCGAPASHLPDPCPQGRSEDLGTVSYWHKNPLRRWLWAANHRR